MTEMTGINKPHSKYNQTFFLLFELNDDTLGSLKMKKGFLQAAGYNGRPCDVGCECIVKFVPVNKCDPHLDNTSAAFTKNSPKIMLAIHAAS